VCPCRSEPVATNARVPRKMKQDKQSPAEKVNRDAVVARGSGRAAPRGASKWRGRCGPTRTCCRQSPAQGRQRPCGEAQRVAPPSAVPGERTTHRGPLGPQAPRRTRWRSRPGAAPTTTRIRLRAAAGSALTSCRPWQGRANSSGVFDKDTAPSAEDD